MWRIKSSHIDVHLRILLESWCLFFLSFWSCLRCWFHLRFRRWRWFYLRLWSRLRCWFHFRLRCWNRSRFYLRLRSRLRCWFHFRFRRWRRSRFYLTILIFTLTIFISLPRDSTFLSMTFG